MICPSCGLAIDDNAMLCPECGVYVKVAAKHFRLCPFCNRKVEIGDIECKHCNAELITSFKKWFQKKSIMVPMIIVEVIIIGFVLSFVGDFFKAVEDLGYRNNRLEIVAVLSETMDTMNNIDSLISYHFDRDRNLKIEYLSYSYEKKLLQNDMYFLLKEISPVLRKEFSRIDNVIITADTPIHGELISKNTIGDVARIDNGFWDKNEWLIGTEFHSKDLM